MGEGTRQERDPRAEMEELRRRCGEMEGALEAIRKGEVDAVVARGPQGDQVYTLKDVDQSYRLLMEQMVQGAPSTDSAKALQAFREDPGAFDIVVTDLTMPGMTGVALAGELLKIRPDIPVILCTGYSEQTGPDEARAAGIGDMLLKPVAAGDMAAAIRRTLDRGTSAERETPAPRARVLVIDDDAQMREVIRKMLEPEGYQVAEAENGKQALRVLENQPHDVVISDIFMPLIDGLGLLMLVTKRFSSLKTIMISGGGRRSRTTS